MSHLIINYTTFLEFENKAHEKYSKSLQITNNNFNAENFSYLKPLFEDPILDKILNIIDDLILYFKFQQETRSLILGDFLFSFNANIIADPATTVFKINRLDYIEHILMRSLINESFGLKPSKYLLLHKKLLIGLRLTNVLTLHLIRTTHNNNWGTAIYFELNIKSKLKHHVPINYSESPFTIIELNKQIYLYGSFRNIWKGKRKRREMEDIKICYKSIIKANQIQFTLASELYNINRSFIEKQQQQLLADNGCTNITEYITKITNIIQNTKYTYSLLKGKERVGTSPHENNINLVLDIKAEHKKIFLNYQKITSIFLLDNNILDKNIFLPCFMDNRGRQYYATLISPTFYKMYRYLYKFTIKKNFNNLEKSTFYNKIIKYKDLIEYKLNNQDTYVLLTLLIEIGKYFLESNKIFISTEIFILTGLQNYKTRRLELDFEDQLYVNKIYSIIDKILNNKIYDANTIIFKDATASGLQNYGILSGYNLEKIKYLNIDGDDWCDTYQYIIEIFLKSKIKQNIINDKIFFNRRHWKKTIMTIPYNAVWYKCFTTFIESLRKDNIEYLKLPENQKNELKTIHQNFYNNIKYNLKKEFYKENKNIILFKYNKWTVMGIEEYKINYKKARDKYTNTIYDIHEDLESTNRALEANNMHYRDSELVKYVLEQHEILPIHDCFGIRLSELHLVIDLINKYYTDIIGIKTYNPFIIK